MCTRSGTTSHVQGVDRLPDDVRKIDPLPVERESPAVQPLEVEQVVQELLQPPGLAVDRAHEIGRLGRLQSQSVEGPCGTDDGRRGRAQMV
jgi:hypothetical protein